ncbi:MAG TPA: class I SAM-dependent methyltransferase [Gemmatimonadaceae bacterium]|nr:class I SAM-dependent methyltransferase [Gemmatimonadaceae bacterium]
MAVVAVVAPLGVVVRLVVSAAAVALLVPQCRKPTWLPGRLAAMGMNLSHRRLTAWGLSHLEIEKHFTILDIGCGGGQTIKQLTTIASEGRVYGIDYSSASVATARRKNASLIQLGRADIPLGSVSALPFSADTFDVVTAIETHYYWPDLLADFLEVKRVLNPGGTFAIVAEAYRGRRMDWLYRPAMRLLRATYLSANGHRDLLTRAGFVSVEIFEERTTGWLCAVGRKAA